MHLLLCEVKDVTRSSVERGSKGKFCGQEAWWKSHLGEKGLKSAEESMQYNCPALFEVCAAV